MKNQTEPAYVEFNHFPLDAEERKNFFNNTADCIDFNKAYTDSKIIGEILTLIEATIPDGKQQEALKSLIREIVFRWQRENTKITEVNFKDLAKAFNFEVTDRGRIIIRNAGDCCSNN